MRPYLKKSFTKIGLVEWLKVKVLRSSPSTEKKKKKRERENSN
jgi:ribosomal protein S21